MEPLVRIEIRFIGENVLQVKRGDEGLMEVVLQPGEVFIELILKNVSKYPLNVAKIYGFTNLIFLEQGISVEDLQPREFLGALKDRKDTEINFRREGVFLQPDQEIYLKIRAVVRVVMLRNPVDIHLQIYCKPLGAVREIVDGGKLVGHVKVSVISNVSEILKRGLLAQLKQIIPDGIVHDLLTYLGRGD